MIQDTTGTGQLCVPNTRTSGMIYCYAITIDLVITDATKGNLTE